MTMHRPYRGDATPLWPIRTRAWGQSEGRIGVVPRRRGGKRDADHQRCRPFDPANQLAAKRGRD